jgi:hypothetical protein
VLVHERGDPLVHIEVGQPVPQHRVGGAPEPARQRERLIHAATDALVGRAPLQAEGREGNAPAVADGPDAKAVVDTYVFEEDLVERPAT